MAYTSNILQIVLDGTGTEIPALNVTDAYDRYIISGAVTATGNYAIVPTGTPQLGTTYIFEYEATLDITTNGTTFSLFGVSFNQTQLISKLEITCYYNGSAWKVKIVGSLDQAFITSTNLNNNSVTNAKLATMADQTIKGNISGGVAVPSDISISALVNTNTWTTVGNSGTVAGTNFVGTTDAIDLVFKTNNTESGRVGLTNQATSLGLFALNSNASGVQTVAIGTNSLFSNTTGDRNVAVGYTTLNDNVSGEDNTALGDRVLANNLASGNTGVGAISLNSNTTGIQNTGIGYSSLNSNTIGDYNTGLGSVAISNVTTGDSNTAVGYSASASLTTGSNNTAIGSGAETNSPTASNRIALGSGAIATSDYQFAIPDGVTTIKFKGIVYTLPTSNAAGVLTNDGSGVLTWV